MPSLFELLLSITYKFFTMKNNERITLIIRKSNSHSEHFGEWRIKSKYGIPGYGKPTSERLSQWRDQFNNSLRKGGSNEHLGMNYWLQCKLEVYNQFTGQVVCSYNSPMFEVIN